MSDVNLIKELRDATNLSFKKINEALFEAGGNKEKALLILKEQGTSIAEKKSDRSTSEGLVHSYIHGNGKIGVLIELHCETDFVARNPMFVELSHELSIHIAAMDPSDIDALMSQEYIKDPSQKITDFLNGFISKLGENIKIGRFVRYSV